MRLIDRQVAIDAIDLSRVQNTHKDPRWSMAHEHEHRHLMKVLYDLPTVDAIPIEFIQKRIDFLHNLAEYDFEAREYELEKLIDDWKKEQEK